MKKSYYFSLCPIKKKSNLLFNVASELYCLFGDLVISN